MKPAIAPATAPFDELRKRLLAEKAGVPVVRVDAVDPHQRAPMFIPSAPRAVG